MNAAATVIRRGLRFAGRLGDVARRRVLTSMPRPARSLDASDPANGPTLVVVAHPDDEVLAAGLLLSRAPSAGVICVTSGATRKASAARAQGFDNWLSYGEARRQESKASLSLLARPFHPSENLGLLDQEVVFDIVALARRLVNPMRSGFDSVVTHPYEGGHPDHDAVALAVHAARILIAREGLTPPALFEAPFYNAARGQYVYGDFLPHEDAGTEFRHELSASERDLKRAMLAQHATQADILENFAVERECFRLAPRYHFAARPHEGEVGYDRFNWPVTGRRWRSLAWRAMRELDMLNELA